MPLVTVLATGGTIASRTDAGGGATAQDGGADLVARLDLPADVELRVRDVFRVGQLPDDAGPACTSWPARWRPSCADDAVDGVVITHGTDTIEETAFFLDLFHADPRPVVVTGAQRAADAPDSDGPRNLTDAVTAAAAPAARGLGVLIGFGGQLFPARGTRKTHTLAADTFAEPRRRSARLGARRGRRRRHRAPARRRPSPSTRSIRPASGSTSSPAIPTPTRPPCGRASTPVRAASCWRRPVPETPTRRSAPRSPSSRPPGSSSSPRPGWPPDRSRPSTATAAGSTCWAGAVPSGLLRPSQARILLAALLGIHRDPAAVRAAFAEHARS